MKNQSHTNHNLQKRTFVWASAVSTLVAILIHVYLVIQHFKLKFGAAGGPSLCDVSDTFNCSAVAASRFSEFLGVPLALWGVAANVVLLLLTIGFPFAEESKRIAARRNLLFVAGFIALASVIMGGISLFALSQFCLFCIATYVLSFASFGFLWKALPRPKGAPFIDASPWRMSDFSPLAILTIMAFAGSYIARDQLVSAYGGAASGTNQQVRLMALDKIALWQASPTRSISTVDPLVLGAPADQAKMTIVEFADFRCIHCKHAAPTLKAFVRSHPDVRLEFQAWPLDGECNSALQHSNGASCMLARVMWCAEKKAAKGWIAHDWMFAQDGFSSSLEIESALPELANKISLPSDELKACVNSSEAKDRVRAMADLGISLNLQGTPTIFANGALLPNGQMLPVLTEAHRVLTEKAAAQSSNSAAN